MTDREYLAACEVNYEAELRKVVEKISTDRDIKLVLIAGPSCAGKTTTMKKLNSYLREGGGIHTYMLSLDDFYKDPAQAPLDEEGNPDFESVYSLDIDYLHDSLHKISIGKTVYVPTFDFSIRTRTDTFRKIKLGENDICFIEGLHAFNPELYSEHVAKKAMYRVFLDPMPYESYPFSSAETRKVRRLVRDYNYRSADAVETLSMWPSVRNGEQKYIYPFASLADVSINTFFEYEASILKNEAIRILGEIKRESEFYDNAQEIIGKLKRYRAIEVQEIPVESMMFEFVKLH